LQVAHGVPTLLMAAASIDDIIAINGFNILLTVAFSSGGNRPALGKLLKSLFSG